MNSLLATRHAPGAAAMPHSLKLAMIAARPAMPRHSSAQARTVRRGAPARPVLASAGPQVRTMRGCVNAVQAHTPC